MANPDETMSKMRLNRFLARAGVASRRHADDLIQAGAVTVNGQVADAFGLVIDVYADQVAVNGEPVSLPGATQIIALNKPTGVYSTMSDPQQRACVADFLDPARFPGFYHIGRLDRDTTGLLLFTNEGTLGNRLMHPAHHVDKTYIAQVEGTPTLKQIEQLAAGIDIKVGERIRHTAPADIAVVKQAELEDLNFTLAESCLNPRVPNTSFVKLTIHQGMKHQVKLMLGAIGHRVVNLHRISFGPINVRSLPLGETRVLTDDETQALCQAAGIM